METNFPYSCGDFSETVYGEIAVYFFEALSPFIREHQGDVLGPNFVLQLRGFIDEEVQKVPTEKIQQWGLPIEQWAPIVKGEYLSRYNGRHVITLFTGPHRFLILHGLNFN